MSASGKSLLGLWLYRSGEQEWAVKANSPIHKPKDFIVIKSFSLCIDRLKQSISLQQTLTKPLKEELTKEDSQPVPSNDRTSIIFTLKHQVGALARALQVFQELGINVLHIELHSGNENETVNVGGSSSIS